MPTGVYKRTEWHRKRLRESCNGFQSGDKHPNWKGGVTNERKRLYNSSQYRLWRTSVFKRDNYTCVHCKERGGALSADHIKPWCDYPELRFILSNGRTLCIDCHRKTHSWGKWDYRKQKMKRVGEVNSGSFKKGHVGYKGNLGKKFSDEHRRKLSEAHKKSG